MNTASRSSGSTSLIARYLVDHYAGSCAGIDFFRRVASGHSDQAVRTAVGSMVAEIQQDQQALGRFLRAAGGRPSRIKNTAARVAQQLGRLKLNGRLVSRSPLSDMIELEGLCLAVTGKLHGWLLLRALADPRFPDAQLETLIDRAEQQHATLDRLRLDQATALWK